MKVQLNGSHHNDVKKNFSVQNYLKYSKMGIFDSNNEFENIEYLDSVFKESANKSDNISSDNECNTSLMYHNSKCEYTDTHITGETIISIFKYYFENPKKNDISLPKISIQAADILATYIEYRLRSIIFEASRCMRFSLSSLSRKKVLTFANVVSTFQYLKIDLFNTNQYPFVSNFVSPLVLKPDFSVFFKNDNSELHILNNISSVFNQFDPDTKKTDNDTTDLSDCCDLSKNAKSISTDFIYDSLNESESKLPEIILHWLAIEGKYIATGYNANIIDCNILDWEVDIDAYNTKLRNSTFIENNIIRKQGPSYNEHDFNFQQDFLSLDIVGQSSKLWHSISNEHVLLLNQLKSTLRQSFITRDYDNSSSIINALSAMQTSPGLKQLVPYLVYFATQQIYLTLKNPNTVMYSVAGIKTMVKALLTLVKNTNIKIHLFIHQILQVFQTIVLYPLLGCGNMSITESTYLRYIASKSISYIIDHYITANGVESAFLLFFTVGNTYNEIIKSERQPIPSLLGAIMGIRCLGSRAIQSLLLPSIPKILQALKQKFYTIDSQKLSPENKNFFNELKGILILEIMGSIGDIINSRVNSTCPNLVFDTASKSTNFAELNLYFQELSEILGDSLVPFSYIKKDSLPKNEKHSYRNTQVKKNWDTYEIQIPFDIFNASL